MNVFVSFELNEYDHDGGGNIEVEKDNGVHKPNRLT